MNRYCTRDPSRSRLSQWSTVLAYPHNTGTLFSSTYRTALYRIISAVYLPSYPHLLPSEKRIEGSNLFLRLPDVEISILRDSGSTQEVLATTATAAATGKSTISALQASKQASPNRGEERTGFKSCYHYGTGSNYLIFLNLDYYQVGAYRHPRGY